MRNPKPGEEINGTIGQDEIWGNSRTPNGVGATGFSPGSDKVPGFLDS